MSYRTLLAILSSVLCARAMELTFELPDHVEQCFHENIDVNVTTLIEFQVVSGGHYDVDVTVQAPNRRVIYRRTREQYNLHHFTADVAGIYALCFSNEFSTFSHKVVYMRIEVGEQGEMPSYRDSLHVMTSMETTLEQLHVKLTNISALQTRYRLREAQGRRRAEELNDRVSLWSAGVSFTMSLVVVGMVVAVRNLFPDHRLPSNHQL